MNRETQQLDLYADCMQSETSFESSSHNNLFLHKIQRQESPFCLKPGIMIKVAYLHYHVNILGFRYSRNSTLNCNHNIQST